MNEEAVAPGEGVQGHVSCESRTWSSEWICIQCDADGRMNDTNLHLIWADGCALEMIWLMCTGLDLDRADVVLR